MDPAEPRVDLRSLAALNLRAARENLPVLAVVLSLALAVLFPVLCFAKLRPLASGLPTWDHWSLVEVWKAHYEGRPVLPLLLRNGAYPPLAAFLHYLLGLLTRWDLHAEVLLCHLAAAATLLLLLRMLWEVRPRLLVLAAPVAACVFAAAQYESFLSGYPLGRMLAQLAATGAIYLLTRPAGGGRAFAGAGACGLTAALAHLPSLGVWPAGLVALGLDRRRRPVRARTVAWLLLAAGSVLLARAAAGGAGVALDGRLLPYFLAVLGRPLAVGVAPPLPLAETLGALLLAAFAALLVRRAKADPADPLLPRWGGYGALAVLAALVAAATGAGGGVEPALSPRAATLAYPLVVAVLVLAAESWERAAAAGGEAARRPALALAAVVAALLLQSWASAASVLPVVRGWARTVADHDRKLADGSATDEEIRQTHHPNPAYVRGGLEILRANRLAAFAEEAVAATIKGNVDLFGGQPLAGKAARVGPGTGWTLEGWAAQSEGDVPVDRVELAVDGHPVATAPVELLRRDVEQYFGSARYRTSGWRLEFPAGALLGPGAHAVRVTARDRAGNAQLIGEFTVEVAAASP